MSGDNEGTSCCASCGIAEVDDNKLKDCGDCDLVKYCSDECRKDHKSEHEEACEKRAAELRDELLDPSCRCASCGITEMDDIELVPCDDCLLYRYCSDECRENHKSDHEEECKNLAAQLQREYLLFRQPECSHLGDCPICCLPLSLDKSKSAIMSCCSKIICNGCAYACQKREEEMRVQITCPFCRESTHMTEEEADKLQMKRIEANDPFAICQKGAKERELGNHGSAISYLTKAAELGDVWAHFQLSFIYSDDFGAEKDEGKYIHHTEEAAIGGHPTARHNLGSDEWGNGNHERAVKHWIISATQGCDESIKALMEAFRQGFLKKDILAAVLRLHKRAVDATKSPQRKEAEGFAQFRSTVDR